MAKKKRNSIRPKQFVRLRKQEGRYLYLAYYLDGKRKYEFLGKDFHLTGTKEIDTEILQRAERLRQKRETEFQARQYTQLPEIRLNANFIQYFHSLTTSKNLKAWTNTAVHLKKHVPSGKLPFRALDAQWLKGFREYLVSNLSMSSAHTYFSCIKAALQQATEEKIITVNPANDVENVKRKDGKIDFLTTNEIRTLAQTPCKSDIVKRAFLFSCFTGLRLSDVKQLTWSNITQTTIEIVQQKTDELLVQPLSEQAASFLGSRGNADDIIFPLLGDEHTRKTIKQWVKEAGITKNVSFHVARHTFASSLASNNVNIYTVSKLMGHTSVKHTERYAKLTDETKRLALEKLPSL
jgi:integrase